MPDPLLALWQPHPDLAAAAAFGPAPPAAPLLWRQRLSPDRDAAQSRLDAIQESIRLAEATAAMAPRRLHALVAAQQAPATPYMAASVPPPAPAEQELLALLRPTPPPGAVAFAWGLPGGWQEAAQEVSDFLEQVKRFIAHYVWVETAVGDDLIARTTVAWTGDFETEWQTRLPPSAESLHQNSLRLALASRAALIRTLSVILSGALLALPLASGPAGVIAALPAVWRFIQRLRQELSASPHPPTP